MNVNMKARDQVVTVLHSGLQGRGFDFQTGVVVLSKTLHFPLAKS